MSWIFGYIGHPPQNIKSKLYQSHEIATFTYNQRDIYITAGGNTQTLFHSKKQGANGWIACGTGIDAPNHKIYTHQDWDNYISNSLSDNYIDGHYIILQWDTDKITCKTDPLGLRDLYILPLDKYTLFSTRTDLIARFHSLELDTNSFGSKWLSVTPLTKKSIFKNMHRICCGSTAIISTNQTKIKEYHWIPSNNNIKYFSKSKIPKLANQFTKLITLPIQAGKELSVSFSAGFDSRLLLACLLNSNLSKWQVHSFGPDKLPDNQVSRHISDHFHIPHERCNQTLSSISKSWELIQTYAAQSLLTDSVSAILQLRYFEGFRNQNKIIIDGWGGEYWRREFFNKLLYFGQKAIIQKNGQLISNYLRVNHGNSFKPEIYKIFEEGEQQSAQELIDSLPDPKKLGIINWLDLFAIRTKLPNAMGPEQTRIDSICQDYMPLSQYSLLKDLFNVPVHYRKNGRLFKEIIQLSSPELTKFPLVKNMTQKPFHMTSLQFRFWEKLHHKFGSPFIYEDKYQFLMQLKEPLMDTFHSKDTHEFDWYHLDNIKISLERFYQGDRNYFNEVDWWITFELFRRAHRIS